MWITLPGACARELRLPATLSSGQAFGWAAGPAGDWRGVLGSRVLGLRHGESGLVEYRQLAGSGDELLLEQELKEYFRMDCSLQELFQQWKQADKRFHSVSSRFEGLRVLRQPPEECIFSFICSSNNNIPRITKMLAALRTKYGVKLGEVEGVEYFSFPRSEVLADSSESDLRSLGMGYRAKYIIGAAKLILEKGKETWFEKLYSLESDKACEELMLLPGVGPKVADCIALFSFSKLDLVPVDTHVWQIARKHYGLKLSIKSQSVTPKIRSAIRETFRNRFGETAGWAHCILFASELPAFSIKEEPAAAEETIVKQETNNTEKIVADISEENIIPFKSRKRRKLTIKSEC